MKSSITFLGTGGGRLVTSSQLRATGGWILRTGKDMIHVDPGPGALVHAKRLGIGLGELTGVVVSHAHPDHYADVEPVIEAMTDSTRKKRGFVLANRTSFHGGGKYHPVISGFHMDLVDNAVAMKPGERYRTEQGTEITAIPAEHSDPNALGYVFKGEVRLGFTGDTGYHGELAGSLQGCDFLLINCLRPRGRGVPMHMDSGSALELIKEVGPRAVILSHFGYYMKEGLEHGEAAWLSEQSGTRVIAATEWGTVDLE